MIVRHQPYQGPDPGPNVRQNWDYVHAATLTSSDFNGLTSTIVTSGIVVPSPGVLFNTPALADIQVDPTFQFQTTAARLDVQSIIISSETFAPGTPLTTENSVTLALTTSGRVIQSTAFMVSSAAAVLGNMQFATNDVGTTFAALVETSPLISVTQPIDSTGSVALWFRGALAFPFELKATESREATFNLYRGDTGGTLLQQRTIGLDQGIAANPMEFLDPLTSSMAVGSSQVYSVTALGGPSSGSFEATQMNLMSGQTVRTTQRAGSIINFQRSLGIFGVTTSARVDLLVTTPPVDSGSVWIQARSQGNIEVFTPSELVVTLWRGASSSNLFSTNVFDSVDLQNNMVVADSTTPFIDVRGTMVNEGLDLAVTSSSFYTLSAIMQSFGATGPANGTVDTIVVVAQSVSVSATSS